MNTFKKKETNVWMEKFMEYEVEVVRHKDRPKKTWS